jgi:hypothetical protein
VSFGDEPSFWRTFGNKFRKRWPQLPAIFDADGFSQWFSLSSREDPFGGKRVVIFIDEFDLLYSAPPTVRSNSLLHTLRGLKQLSTGTTLHSVVAVGPFSILQLTTSTGSPFNTADAIRSPLFTLEQVQGLFKQFEEAVDCTLDAKIAVDVHERTLGHMGLVGFCGKMIDDELLCQSGGTKVISISDWLQFALRELPLQARKWQSMGKMVKLLSGETVQLDEVAAVRVVDARKLLCTYLLPVETPVRFQQANDLELAGFLVAEGAATVEDGAYRVRCDLVRAMLLTQVLPLRLPPLKAFPQHTDYSIDITRTMLELAVSAFDRETFVNASYQSFKKALPTTGG